MANMSYCRFENTCHDFYDCLIALENDGLTELSTEERYYAERLYKHAQKFIDAYEEALDDMGEDDEEEDYDE